MTNQYTAANDNPEGRPAAFDKRLMEYMPGLTVLARKLSRHPKEREDLVTDTIIYCLGHWTSYREDGGFWNWLYWSMRGVLSSRRDAYGRQLKIVDDADGKLLAGRHVDATQLVHMELVQTLESMTARGGNIVIRRAMGDGLGEIGADMGISKERVRQIEEKELNRLQSARAA
ncbi:sigma-70 family RNA polymerase sigma factor [Rhizobium sp. 768_B6_N1_8]|uniref:sigma-70 family RNA polymerase sigma factor n=1 Tax=unclassified Rhizobium TaxID=2613769 RepID=UPI003F1EAA10